MKEQQRLQLGWPENRTAAHLGRADVVCLITVFILMLISTLVHSRGRIFWSDELMGWMVIREKTFGSMFRNWRLGLDSGSLFYLVGGRIWTSLLSTSELSFRLFSATFIGVSFVIFWIAARRLYSFAIVALVVPVTYFLNTWVDWQLYNGRMYGGFMAASALTIYAFVVASQRRDADWRLLALTFAGHAFLLASHILGIFYSAFFVLGLVAQDLWLKQWRPRLYLSAFAGWSVLIVALKNIQSIIASGKPAYWTARPTAHDLLKGFTVYSGSLQSFVLIAGIAAVLAFLYKRRPDAAPEIPRRIPVYFLLATFCAILLAAYVISLFTASIFFNRYLLPVVLGDALLVCELFYQTYRRLPASRALHVFLAVVLAAFFVFMYVGRLRMHYLLPELDYTEALLAKDPPGVPMVITDIKTFSEMVFYRNNRTLMLMPVDWPINLDPEAGPGGAAGLHEMDGWKAVGYYSDQILPTQDILSRYSRFVVVSEPSRTLWLRHYLQNNPRYDVQDLGNLHGDNLWLVSARAAK